MCGFKYAQLSHLKGQKVMYECSSMGSSATSIVTRLCECSSMRSSDTSRVTRLCINSIFSDQQPQGSQSNV
jgi:hypothetical protein